MDKNQQTIDSLLNSAGSQSSDQISQLMDKIQPMLQLLIVISTLLTIALIVLYLFNSIHKWRVNRAILRMDKNLQLLVDAQIPTPAKVDEAES
jgi:hypothetical protein